MTDIIKVIDILPDEAKHLAQKLHRKKEDIEVYRKALIGEVESADEERTIVARVSTNDRDRDGEIIEPKGIDLKDYQANPVLCWAHSYSTPPVGKALWSKTDEKGMVCKFQFAQTQFAEDIYQLYKGGYLRAFSIGFIPMDYDSKTKTFNRVSILEVSAVPVPANQNALVMEAFAKGIVSSEALKKDLGIDEPAPVSELTGEEVPANAIEADEKATPEPDEIGEEPIAEAKADEAEEDPEVVVVDVEELDELTASVRDLALQQNALIKRIDELAEAIGQKAVEAAQAHATAEVEPVPAPAPEPAPEPVKTITITAPVEKSAVEQVLDVLRSREFDERVRIIVDRAIGRVR